MAITRTEVLVAVAPAFRLGAPLRDDLIFAAREQAVPEELVSALQALPQRRYNDVRDVWRELSLPPSEP